MSEEIRREAGLNEAALENASGGAAERDYEFARNYAAYICSGCDLSLTAAERQQHFIMLKDYIARRGDVSLSSHLSCPYYKT